MSGRDLQPSQYNSERKGIPYITGASNIDNGKIYINRWTESPVTISIKDDLLITCKGTIGKLSFNTIGDIHIARQLMALRLFDVVDKHYLKYCLEERIEDIKRQDNGLIPGIERAVLLNQTIPLPPLSEQRRIANRITESFTILDEIIQSLN